MVVKLQASLNELSRSACYPVYGVAIAGNTISMGVFPQNFLIGNLRPGAPLVLHIGIPAGNLGTRLILAVLLQALPNHRGVIMHTAAGVGSHLLHALVDLPVVWGIIGSSQIIINMKLQAKAVFL